MFETTSIDAKILILDDQESNVILLENILYEEDFTSFRSITDSRKTVAVFLEYQPDIVLLDLQMPHMDGYEVMRLLKMNILPGDFLPILILTANITPEAKWKALGEGAMDFITKPFDPAEVVLRIKNLLQTRLLHLQLHEKNFILEQKVHERTLELEETQKEILERLAFAADYRDDDTGEHTRRVGNLSAKIAQALGLSEKEVELIRRAAPLHDVGKIAIPDSILLKSGELTSIEFERIKTHTVIGSNILSGGRFPLLQRAEEIAFSHHERWDGSGYQGLAEEAIPLAGRIVAVADVFDALISERPYKKAWPHQKAIDEIKYQSGRQFDPRVVEAFLKEIEL